MIDDGTRVSPSSSGPADAVRDASSEFGVHPRWRGSQDADHLLGWTERRGFRGTQTFTDGVHRFSVGLLGAGSVDWSFDPDLGELRLLGIRGTDGTSALSVIRHAGHDFHVADARLTGRLGSFRSNALFDEVTFTALLGPFAFSDGRLEEQFVFPTETVVHYDGALGTLDAAPLDGSLSIETRRDLWAGTGPVALCARASQPGAEVSWRQVRGPRLWFEAGGDGRCSIAAEALPPGRRAVFVVSARDGDALAIETVVVRGGLQTLG